MLGSQAPRIRHSPEYVSSSGPDAVELAGAAGLVLDEWQRLVLVDALGERAGGGWAAQTVGLTVGRQNGKNTILEARELAGLFLLGERLIIHTAHLQKTATSHFERMLELVDGVAEFRRRVLRAPRGKGSEAIRLRGGQTILFTTRARGGGRGLTADLIVYDEAMYLSEQDRAALVPTLAARSMTANIQTWYAGSAVDQQDTSQDGVPFAQVRRAGIAAQPGVLYMEWSAPGDDPDRVPEDVAADPGMWALANPGLGIRISHEWVEHERTVEMGARAFAVERLGIGDWPDVSGESARVIPAEQWVLLAERDPANRIVDDVCLAVDSSPDHAWATVAVAGRRADGLWQTAVVDHRRGKGWVLARCVRLLEDYPQAQVVIDSFGPAANLVGDLQAAGVDVLEVATQDYAAACADFLDAARDLEFRYPFPQPELDEAVSNARQTRLGDRWKWGRRASTSSDITPLVACTLALWGARNVTSRFANVMITTPAKPQPSEQTGARAPVVIDQEQVTDCFACRTGRCDTHQQ